MLDAKSLEPFKIHTNLNVLEMLIKVVTKKKQVFFQDGVGMETLPYVR